MKEEEPKFISLAEAARLTNYSQDYISLLCRQRKLRAEKLGRNWVTTKEWVYKYVDSTDGKGESVVPVRVRNVVSETKEIKSEKKEGNRSNWKEKNFYGQPVLEAAFFCFACLIWSINIFLFITYWKEGDFNSDSFVTVNDYSVYGAAASHMDGNLLTFEKETDPSLIERRTAEVKAALGQDINVEIYNSFAVITNKDGSARESLYIFK